VLKRVWLIAGLLVAACEPTPTPFPMRIEATAPAAISTAPVRAAYRYAVAPNAVGLLIDTATIDADVIYLDAPPTLADAGTQFDYAVALGVYPDAQRSPQSYEVSLIVRTDAPPLDNPDVQDVIRRAAVPSELAAGLELPGLEFLKDEPSGDLRAALASAGYPDGFDLTLAAVYAPGIDALAARLRGAGISVEIVQSGADVTLTADSALPDRIPLFRAPISYWIAPNMPLNLSSSGIPLPPSSRQ
jgi:hypothetical protein